MFLHKYLLTSLNSSLTPLFFIIRKLALRTNEIKRQRAINQSNHIIHIFDLRRTLPKYLRIFFSQKCSTDDWSNKPIRLQYLPLYGQTFHQYSKSNFICKYDSFSFQSVIFALLFIVMDFSLIVQCCLVPQDRFAPGVFLDPCRICIRSTWEMFRKNKIGGRLQKLITPPPIFNQFTSKKIHSVLQ